MKTLEAIYQRRSIRKFLPTEIPKEILEKILSGAILAPSSKNRQPWKFIVVTNLKKASMIQALEKGINNEKSLNGLLPESLQHIHSAENTLKIMAQAPITILVFNRLPHSLWRINPSIEDKFFDIANIQSIGAAIQNMILIATSFGIGSLWICDIFFAYRELTHWLDEKDQLIGAVTLGYPDESPNFRNRYDLSDLVLWK